MDEKKQFTRDDQPPSYSEAVGGPILPQPGYASLNNEKNNLKLTEVDATAPTWENVTTDVPPLTLGPTVVIVCEPMTDQSEILFCPHCQRDVKSVVTHQPGIKTHAWAGSVCLLTTLCCLCFSPFCGIIPYCIKGCKDAYHECENCGIHLGIFKRKVCCC